MKKYGFPVNTNFLSAGQGARRKESIGGVRQGLKMALKNGIIKLLAGEKGCVKVFFCFCNKKHALILERKSGSVEPFLSGMEKNNNR